MPDYATGDTVRYKPIGGELLYPPSRPCPLIWVVLRESKGNDEGVFDTQDLIPRPPKQSASSGTSARILVP